MFSALHNETATFWNSLIAPSCAGVLVCPACTNLLMRQSGRCGVTSHSRTAAVASTACAWRNLRSDMELGWQQSGGTFVWASGAKFLAFGTESIREPHRNLEHRWTDSQRNS